MKNKFLKIISISIIIIFCLQGIILANDEDIENIELKEILQEIAETGADVVKEPVINSRAAVVFDRTSEEVVYEKNSTQKRAMASTTKVMTAVLVLEMGNLNDVVEVSLKAANTGGSRLGLKKGDKITLNDLLYGLMLCSRQ